MADPANSAAVDQFEVILDHFFVSSRDYLGYNLMDVSF